MQRDSTVEAITCKTGSTGPLGFVSVRHDYGVAGQCRVSKRQDLACRNELVPGSVAPSCTPDPNLGPPLADINLLPDPVLLFRFSAGTFNGHRIPYNRRYATGVEGYGDLVVHGPLQPTLMLTLRPGCLGLVFRGSPTAEYRY